MWGWWGGYSDPEKHWTYPMLCCISYNALPAAAVRELLVVSFLTTSVHKVGECLPPETARIVG